MSINLSPLRRIGAGFRGSVWADPGSQDPIVSACSTTSGRPQVIKREDGGPGRSVQNEHAMHQRLLQALREDTDTLDHDGSEASFHVNFPDSYAFLAASNPAWSHNYDNLLNRFSAGYIPCNALVNERIPPMPLAVRRLLVERYCPPSLEDAILRDGEERRLPRPRVPGPAKSRSHSQQRQRQAAEPS